MYLWLPSFVLLQVDRPCYVELIGQFELECVRLLALEEVFELDQGEEAGQFVLHKVLVRDL